MRAFANVCLALVPILVLSGCSGVQGRQTKIYSAGEKATVNRLTYAVVDTQIQPRLGDDTNPRTPANRFYIVSVAVSSGANEDLPIPEMTLVDDGGKTYNELPDGTGVAHWLGMIRHVSPAQTERGAIVFDAPAAHYKLKLTNETDDSDAFIDLPLNFVHEQINNAIGGSDGSTETASPK
jgi:hypothetical protein